VVFSVLSVNSVVKGSDSAPRAPASGTIRTVCHVDSRLREVPVWRRPLLPLVTLVIAVIVALPVRAQQKPFTQDQVQAMVRDGLADETGAKAIGQRGIDFATAARLFLAGHAAPPIAGPSAVVRYREDQQTLLFN